MLWRALEAAAVGWFMDDEIKTYGALTIDGHFDLGAVSSAVIRYFERVSDQQDRPPLSVAPYPPRGR